jgi:hypothetical protein
MATNYRASRYSGALSQRVNGQAVFLNDVFFVSSAPVATDAFDFLLPKGIELSTLSYAHTALYLSGMSACVGIAPATVTSSLVVDLFLFKNVFSFGAGRSGFNCYFPPRVFEEDVLIRLTSLGGGAGFAAGTISVTAGGNQVGVD